MASLLVGLCALLFFGTPPALLTVKLVSPHKLPWWVLVTAVALLSWLLLVLADYLVRLRDSECEARVVGDSIVMCPLVDYWYTYNWGLGWLKGLIYLLPWLAIFGIAKFIQRRRNHSGGSPPNTSLERTREG